MQVAVCFGVFVIDSSGYSKHGFIKHCFMISTIVNNLINAKQLQKKEQQQMKVSAYEEKDIFQLIQNAKVKSQNSEVKI